jgi:LysM repeat protein
MKLAILISSIVAASALPSSDAQASGLVSRGRSQVKEVRLKRRKGSKGYKGGSKGSKCHSKGSKHGSRSRSCGGHGHDYGHDDGPDTDYVHHPEPEYQHKPQPAPHPEPYVESGNLPHATENTYKESGNLPSAETYAPRVPSVCESGEILTVVLKGDTLDAIAQANGYDLQKLIDANPQFADPDLIFPTDEVCIPADCKTGYTGPVDSHDAPTHDDSIDITDLEEGNDDSEVILEDPALQQSSAFKNILSILATVTFVFAL